MMVRKLEASALYVFRWEVDSRTSNKKYVVSMKADGTWACACPHWKFHKAPKPICAHIEKIQSSEPVDRSKTPTIDRMIPRRVGMNVPQTPGPRVDVPRPAATIPYYVVQTRRAISLED